jgi:protein-disulfide isomerase
MAKSSKQKVTIFIIVACLFAVLTGQFILQHQRSHVVRGSLPAKAKGNPQAKLKIVEYIDFECPACAQGTHILKEFFAKYPNQIYLEVKYFPLPSHTYGMVSARWAECAGRQNKFWAFVDPLMERQNYWATLHDPVPALRQIAEQAGLSSFQLDNCLNNKYLDETILTEKAIGTSLGIQSTPTYFINDKMIVGTKTLVEELDKFFGQTPATPTATSQ